MTLPAGCGSPARYSRSPSAIAAAAAGIAQDLQAQRQNLPEPDGMLGVIGVRVAGAGVEEDGQPVAVEHQPRQERTLRVPGGAGGVQREQDVLDQILDVRRLQEGEAHPDGLAQQWQEDNPITTNPMFGSFSIGDQEIESERDDLAFPASQSAKDASSGSADYFASLPESQRCG